MISININDIKKYLNDLEIDYKYVGNEQLVINGFCSLNNIKNNCITWIKNIDNFNIENFADIENILIVSNEIINIENFHKNINYIFCKNPKEVFFTILDKFF